MSALRRLMDDLLGRQISTRADLVDAISEAGSDDLISRTELTMVQGVLRLFEQTVDSLRIPVGRVVWMRLGDPLSDMLGKINASGHSRYPVLRPDVDRVAGILHVKHLLRGPVFQEDYRLGQDLLRTAKMVPASTRLDAMLREFRSNRVHMAVVGDERGKMDGVVTLEDVLERIVGDIRDEFDADEGKGDRDLIADGSPGVTTVRSGMDIDDFNREFSSNLDTSYADTIGGWFSRELGKVARIGDRIEAGGLVVTVSAVDERRVISFEVRGPRRKPGKKQRADQQDPA